MPQVRYVPPYESYSLSAGAKKFVSASAVADYGNSQAIMRVDQAGRSRIGVGSVTWTNRSGSTVVAAVAVRFGVSTWAAGQITAAGAFTDDTEDAQDAGTGDFSMHDRTASGSGFMVSADEKFNILGIVQSAAGDQTTPVLVLEYWNGSAWTNIASSALINDALIGNGTGEKVLMWPMPANWAKGGSGTGVSSTQYNIRVRHTTAAAGSADPVASQIFVGEAKAIVIGITDDNLASMERQPADAEMRFARSGEALFPVFEVANFGNLIEVDARLVL